MADAAAELFIRIEADMADLKRELKGAGKAAKRATDGIKQGFAKAGMAASGMAGKLAKVGIAAAGIAAAFVSVRTAMKTLEEVDALAKTSDRLGITTKKLAGLQLAAELTGGSVSGLSTSLQMAARNISDAADGTGTASDALKKMGIDAKELQALSPDKQLAAIADGMNKLGTQGEKVSASMDIFGRSGADMVNMLAGGSKALEDAAKKAEAFGLAISRQDAAGIEGLNDALTMMGSLFDGIARKFIADLAPSIEALVTMTTNWGLSVATTGDMTDTVIDAIGTGIKWLGNITAGMAVIWDGIKVAIGSVSVAFWSTAKVVAQVVAIIKDKYNALDNYIGWVASGWGSMFEAVWQGIVQSLGSATESMMGIMGRAMRSMGETIASTGIKGVADLGRSIQNAGGDMIVMGVRAKQAIGGDLAGALADVDEKAKGANAALANLTSLKMPAIDTSTIDANIKEAQRFTQESASDLRTSVDAARPDEEGNTVGDKMRTQFQDLVAANEERNALVAETVAAGREAAAVATAEADASTEEGAKRHEANLSTIKKEGDDTRVKFTDLTGNQQLSLVGDTLGQIASVMDKENKTQFKIAKAAGIAQATISTFQGVNNALANVPYPFNFVAAATVAAAGIANVSKISQQQFGGGGGGGASAGGAPAGGGGGSGGGGGGTPNAEAAPQQTQFNIGLTGSSFSGEQVRALIGEINDQTDDNVELRATVQ